jgi:hypothetical protein
LIWVVPPVGLAVALGGLFLILREMRRRRSVPAIAGMDAPDEVLATYLEAVDREMRQSEAASDPENDTPPSQNRPENEGGGVIKL